MCFKWAILVKHVEGGHRYCVGKNYEQQEYRYNFTGLTFPIPVKDIAIFEKKHPDLSVYVQGLKNVKRKTEDIVYPLRIVKIVKILQ